MTRLKDFQSPALFCRDYPNLDKYLDIIKTEHENYSNYNNEVLQKVSSPKTKKIDEVYEISFFTYGHYTTQSPYGLNKWLILFDRNGKIKNKEIELIFEFDYPDKIKYGDSIKKEYQ